MRTSCATTGSFTSRLGGNFGAVYLLPRQSRVEPPLVAADSVATMARVLSWIAFLGLVAAVICDRLDRRGHRMLPTGLTVQSGWPGIGGVFSPYTHSRRNGVTLRSPLISAASAMKSSVLATPSR